MNVGTYLGVIIKNSRAYQNENLFDINEVKTLHFDLTF